MRGSEPWTITTRSLAVLPHSAYRLSLAFFFTSSRFEPGTAASAAVPLSTDANEKSRQFKNTTPEMCEDPAEPFVCPRYPPPASPDNLERFPRLAQCAGKILAKDLALRETKNRERARLPVLSGLMGTLCPPPLWQEVYTVRKLTPLLSSM